MAKCSVCKTKKGKRYCAPIDSFICPVCCAEGRMKEINCVEECKHLGGVVFQKKREEEKHLAQLKQNVPHGQYDDIFKDKGVSAVAGDIETYVAGAYAGGDIKINDNSAYEAYKHVYLIYFDNRDMDEDKLNDLTKELIKLYRQNIAVWKSNIGEEKVGQVFLRLMISVKKMSCGALGRYSYLDYLKRNFPWESRARQDFARPKIW